MLDPGMAMEREMYRYIGYVIYLMYVCVLEKYSMLFYECMGCPSLRNPSTLIHCSPFLHCLEICPCEDSVSAQRPSTASDYGC